MMSAVLNGAGDRSLEVWSTSLSLLGREGKVGEGKERGARVGEDATSYSLAVPLPLQ